MSHHREHWRCTEGHGVVREYSDPEGFESSCPNCGHVTQHYVNRIIEGDRCFHMPVWISSREPWPKACEGRMVLERDDVLSESGK